MTAAATLTLRVSVPEVWDAVRITTEPEVSVRYVKERALKEATGKGDRASEYLVKFRGAAVLDEERQLGELGVPDGGSLIVLHRRRRPVR